MYVNLLVIICFLFVGLSVRSELFLAAEPFSTFFTPLHFMYLCVPFHVLSGIEFLLTNNTDRFNVLLHVFLQEVLIWLSHKTFVANKTCWTVPHMLMCCLVFVHCCVFTRCARMHWNFVCNMFFGVVLLKFGVGLEFLHAHITFKKLGCIVQVFHMPCDWARCQFFFSNIYISAFQHLPLRSAVQPHDKNQLQTKVVSLLLQICNFRSFAISCLSNLYVHMAAILGKSQSSANYVT